MTRKVSEKTGAAGPNTTQEQDAQGVPNSAKDRIIRLRDQTSLAQDLSCPCMRFDSLMMLVLFLESVESMTSLAPRGNRIAFSRE